MKDNVQEHIRKKINRNTKEQFTGINWAYNKYNDVTIEKDYKDEAILFKDNIDKEIGKSIYVSKIGNYLEEFKKYAEEELSWQLLKLY